jgi:hypothetical protein
LELYDNILKYKDKINNPKKQGVFAQAGKPVPPRFLQPGELFGLGKCRLKPTATSLFF